MNVTIYDQLNRVSEPLVDGPFQTFVEISKNIDLGYVVFLLIIFIFLVLVLRAIHRKVRKMGV